MAVAYHTRAHGFGNRPEYVLVQGTASLGRSVPDYPPTIRDVWERYAGQGTADVGPVMRWWQRVFRLRVEIQVAVERIIVWPDLECGGSPQIVGLPAPDSEPAAQRPPKNGVAPRINHRRAAAKLWRLPHRLLGWVGADGFPLIVPVDLRRSAKHGMVVECPAGLIPPGDRRAGLTAHWFSRHALGQNQKIYTGWLEADSGGRSAVYAPHTAAGYWMPPSLTLFKFATGAATRWWFHRNRQLGRAGEMATHATGEERGPIRETDSAIESC